ncbi:MAG: patatin-like phospholipase family protein [SAR324 cluster bacterium]|nr:patatin-like phospholipase family protein [SAR324 cluster bacterium]
MANTEEQKITLGLALSGGVARGIAHIGVLKALEEHDLVPDFISANSSGAVIGSLYAFGMKPEQIRELATTIRWFDISGLAISKMGLLSNDDIRKFMEKHIGDSKIEDSPIPLAIMTTDISTGEKVVLREGQVSQAIMATTCIPGIFIPKPINGRLLVDGAIVENIPVSPLLEMGADVIVGVNLNFPRKFQQPDGLVDTFLNAMSISVDMVSTFQTKHVVDVMIGLDLAHYPRTGVGNAWELYAEGYRGGMLAVKKIKAVIKKKQPSSLKKLTQKLKDRRTRETPDQTQDDSDESSTKMLPSP